MRPLSLLPLALLGLLLGCSANVSGAPEPGDAEVGASAAVVVVERTGGTGDSHASAVARFVRMRSGAVDEDALRLVGAAVDFPPLGACAAPAFAPASAARKVELLDVGAVSLEAEGVRTALAARQLPDVVDLISGVVYSTRASDAAWLPADGTYVLRAAGAFEAEIPAFEATATAPGEPSSLLVGGQDARALVVLSGGAPVDLTWDAGAADDLLYVDVTSGAATAATVRCLFEDAAGRATIPPSAFADGAAGTVLVHRLHRESFRARGIDTGEIRFDIARAVGWSRL